MDEYDQGMDPQVKRYFRKIINSFSVGLIWLLTMAMAGLYFRLGIVEEHIRWYNTVFFFFAFISLCALLYYFYKTWKDG